MEKQEKKIPFVFTAFPNFFLLQEYFRDHEMILLALWLFQRTDYRRHEAFLEGKTITLEAGEFIFGRKKCSEETGLSEQVIRTRLHRLLNHCWITKITTKSTTKFTVYKWVWENFPHYANHQNNRKITSYQPQKNHNQEEKNPNLDFIRKSMKKGTS